MWRHVLENKMTWAYVLRVSVYFRLANLIDSWYNLIIASGGVSLLIYHLPYRAHWLWVLGKLSLV